MGLRMGKVLGCWMKVGMKVRSGVARPGAENLGLMLRYGQTQTFAQTHRTYALAQSEARKSACTMSATGDNTLSWLKVTPPIALAISCSQVLEKLFRRGFKFCSYRFSARSQFVCLCLRVWVDHNTHIIGVRFYAML